MIVYTTEKSINATYQGGSTKNNNRRSNYLYIHNISKNNRPHNMCIHEGSNNNRPHDLYIHSGSNNNRPHDLYIHSGSNNNRLHNLYSHEGSIYIITGLTIFNDSKIARSIRSPLSYMELSSAC